MGNFIFGGGSRSLNGGGLLVSPAVKSSSTTALAFASQPQSKTVDEYALATFSCEVAGGVAPYTYQWKKNGINLGTNSANLSFTAATDKNAVITLVVTDSAGKVAYSIPASLTVTRNVVAFNGVTQELTFPKLAITNNADFEIELNVITTVVSGHLLSEKEAGATFRIFYLVGDKIEIATSFAVSRFNLPAGVFPEKLILKRVAGVISITNNGINLTEQLNALNSGNINISSLGGKWGSSTSVPTFDGKSKGLKIWTGGDRNTGTLVRDYRMNDGWENNPVCVNSATTLGVELFNGYQSGYVDADSTSILVNQNNTAAKITNWVSISGAKELLIRRANSTRLVYQSSIDNVTTSLVSVARNTDPQLSIITVPVGATHFRVYYSNPADVGATVSIKRADGYGNYIGLTAASWSKETLS